MKQEEGIQTELEEGTERTMEKEKKGWKRNMELADESWLERWNGSHLVCRARTGNLNKLCETQDR